RTRRAVDSGRGHAVRLLQEPAPCQETLARVVLSAAGPAPIVTERPIQNLRRGSPNQPKAAMDVTRRDFFTLIAIAGGLQASSGAALARALEPDRLLDFPALGNVTLLHMTDPHGTLLPVYYREPDTRLGVGDEVGKPAFLTGTAFLKAYGITPG